MEIPELPVAGKSNFSRQYKEPSARISKTYQDSNIFGTKDFSSSTVTAEAKKDFQRATASHNRAVTQKSEINEVFTNDDKMAREKLKKTNGAPFEPTYEKSSPIKRYVTEFYGEQFGQTAEKSIRPHTALTRSITLPASNAADIKRNALQSNIFSDDTKAAQLQSNRANIGSPEKLVSVKSKWDSKDASGKAHNLRKSEDLSNQQLSSFAQNKKRHDWVSDIFNTGQPIENKQGLNFEAKAQNSKKSDFVDKTNEDIKKTQHLFSSILSHEDKTYTYNKEAKNQADPLIASNMVWSDSKTEAKSPNKNQSPNEKKLAHLTSTVGTNLAPEGSSPTKVNVQPIVSEKALEREMMSTMSPQQKKGFEMKSDVPLGESSQSWAHNKATANDSSQTFDFDLKSIPKGMELEGLKKIFSGYHVVELKADRNNLSGSQSGNGRVKIRANSGHDMLKLKHDLKSHGILMLSHFEKHNRKNNYRDLAKINWHDQHLQSEEHRIKSGFDNVKESKLQNLESEGEVFGNSKGVGKWNRKDLEKNAKKDAFEQKSPEDLVRTQNWEKTIKKVPNTRPSTAQSATLQKKSIKPTKPFK